MTGFGHDGTEGAESGEPLSVDRAVAEEDEFQASLVGLSRLVTGISTLEDVLTQVAEFAVRAIPGADGAGVTLLENGQADTIVASTPFVREVDAIQYGLGEGPCITAAAERRTVRSGSLGGERLWPRFGPRIGRLGVHSVVSLPLLLSEEAIGAINVYAHSKDAFADHAVQLGELFAEPAAVAVHNARVLAQAQRLTARLQSALTNRAVIDQAIGILMSRNGGGAEQAFNRLRTISQAENRKLSAVAQQLVDEAVRRARTRHTRP